MEDYVGRHAASSCRRIMSRQRKLTLSRILQALVCLGVVSLTLKLTLAVIGDESRPLPADDDLRKLMVSHGRAIPNLKEIKYNSGMFISDRDRGGQHAAVVERRKGVQKV